jgi:hypothetical protein
MPTVADVVRRFGAAYLQQFGQTLPADHQQVLRSIAACRTGQLGTVCYACITCGRKHMIGRSCGNRHCPACQCDKTKAWLEKQTARLLPCPYFLLTFTVPAELRDFVRSHPRECYEALFAASSQALQTLAADPRHLGGKCGFSGVLHTWGRSLDYHPHVHYIVPGGALDPAGNWKPSRVEFFLPVRALSVLYRAKFRAAMQAAGLYDQIDPVVWEREWVVHSQAVGDGRASLRYLAPYVFRVAISDRRIVRIEDGPDGQGRVTFSYRKSGTSHWRPMTVTATEFLRRFLQHVLPKGLQKVRHYGFLSPHARPDIESVRWLVTLHNGEVWTLLATEQLVQAATPPVRCAECGGAMVVVGFIPATDLPRGDTAQAKPVRLDTS